MVSIGIYTLTLGGEFSAPLGALERKGRALLEDYQQRRRNALLYMLLHPMHKTTRTTTGRTTAHRKVD